MMQQSTQKHSSVLTKRPGFVVAGGVALTLLALYFGQADEEIPQPTVVPSQSAAPARFGPGIWTDPAPPATMTAVPMASDTAAPEGLATTADGHIVVNKALKDVVDYFLLGGYPGERAEHAEKLLAHLKLSLPQPASDEAAQIAQNYLRYLDEHDKLLARAPVPPASPESTYRPPDIERISVWVAQRARLRQDLLGIHVAGVWFGEEEANDQQLLASLRERGSAIQRAQPEPQQHASNTLQEMRTKGASLQAQREYVASQFGEQAAQRFDAIEGKEQAWRKRYADYRSTAEAILRQPGIDAGERARQIEALRAHSFSTEPERVRARNLDTLPAPTL